MVLHWELSETYYFKGMLKESITEAEKTLELEGDHQSADALHRAYQSGGYRAAQEWRLGEWQKKAKDRYVTPLALADISATLEQRDQTILYLEETFDQHAPALIWLKLSPHFDWLHSDPRYQALVKRIGLP